MQLNHSLIQSQRCIRHFDEKSFDYSDQKGSSIKMKKAFFYNVLFKNNNYQYFWNGLLFFALIDFEQIRISELSCIKNYIKDNGSILAISDQRVNTKLLINHQVLYLIIEEQDQEFKFKIQQLNFQIQKSQIILHLIKQVDYIFKKIPRDLLFNLHQIFIIQQSMQVEYIQMKIAIQIKIIQFNLFSYLIMLNWLPIILMNYLNICLYQQIKQKYNFNKEQLKIIISSLTIKSIQNNILRLSYINQYFIYSSGYQIQNFELYNPIHLKLSSYITEFKINFKN
ncbi:unnamed protein product [Paramecium pentaurelia]|uniref:Transmembrane protein n=1 Tax=Paramecium pentaurelia TaxID=43138 RepID=A0A8S1T4M7_9CILI|nr:unnamed protein product [Paramecium pentaurelia]